MSEQQINDRLNDLSAVINYDFYKDKRHFTAGEKICINQERGSLSDKLYVLKGEMSEGVAREYKISENLEKKVQFVLNKLTNEKEY